MKLPSIIVAMAISSIPLFAEGPFNGLVVDATGAPVNKARIWVTDKEAYATTDKRGRFGLSDVDATDTLHLKIKKEIYRIPVDGRKAIKITIIEPGVQKAEEEPALADLGYGYVKRRERVAATNGISGERLRATGANDIMSALRGIVPGLNVSTSPRGGTTTTLRGEHSLNSSNEPLYVVDGVIVPSLDHFNIYDVEMVEVLKDAPIYGSRGANGAILVTTVRASGKR